LNGNNAQYTRQNPNGNRYGLECAEERDYYPWWNPSPWKDIAIFVSDTDWCAYYTKNSQNVLGRYICSMTTTQRQSNTNDLYPIDNATCLQKGGQWTMVGSFGIAAPECMLHPISRDNHLGNVAQVDSSGNPQAGAPLMAYYDWTLPSAVAGLRCAIRIRYNISSVDYPAMNFAHTDFTESKYGTFWDWRYNCPTITDTASNLDSGTYTGTNTQCYDVLTDNSVPLYERPFIRIWSGFPQLGIAFNTNQVGRTFQDRSYVFRGLSLPSNVSSTSTIWNLGYRGRRGNIVQCYPAVEYDFVPTNLTIDSNTWVHIQFCGSDFDQQQNPNDVECCEFSSRTIMVQIHSLETQFPMAWDVMTMWGANNNATAEKFAFVGITNFSNCHTFPNSVDTNNDNSIHNCGKLNPAPTRFDGGLVQFASGTYHYVSTRNNNFSNRSQKGSIQVSKALTAAETAAVVIAAVAGAGGVAGACVLYGKKRPDSRIGRLFSGRKGEGTLL